MKKVLLFLLLAATVLSCFGCARPLEQPNGPASDQASDQASEPISLDIPFESKTLVITENELCDKIEGGWIGQMAGVVWGAPTEFGTAGRLMPAAPTFSNALINDAFGQDDLYVEIPFLDAMKKNGVDCAPEYCAEAFAKTSFALWHANGMARQNLLDGIGYPDSGSYLYNYHADDIDWQIECDFLGMLYPGQPWKAAARAFELGHIMNYGDGVYGGVFVSAMHAAAFTAENVREICDAGIAAIPEGSSFRALLDLIVENYESGMPFEQNWQSVQKAYGDTDICPELPGVSNIDAKLNSGYVLLGLLYGEGDPDASMKYSMRCGQDSDCNPSTVGSILGNFYGASGLNEKYAKKLDRKKTKFSFTRYNFNQAVELNRSLAEEAFEKSGIAKENGSWTFESEPILSQPLEQIPDGIYAYLRVETSGNRLLIKEITPYGKNEKPVGYTLDMGDGFLFTDMAPTVYTYAKSGTYQVKVTVRAESGKTGETVRTVKVGGGSTADTIPVCTVVNPYGSGARDLAVIMDGVVDGTDPAKQFDTYILSDPHGNPTTFQAIGVVYRTPKTVGNVVFTEGAHFDNGGWFLDDLHIEVLRDGAWKTVDTTVSPAYTEGGAAPYESFTFRLQNAVTCDGVRIAGSGGGSKSFVSCAEFTVG